MYRDDAIAGSELVLLVEGVLNAGLQEPVTCVRVYVCMYLCMCVCVECLSAGAFDMYVCMYVW